MTTKADREIMTTTILTDDEIASLAPEDHTIPGTTLYDFARNIEQAVLQSPEIQALRKDAETERAIQRAAEVLPRDWQITIEVEQDSGYVNLHFQGDEIEFGEPSDGIADRIKDAISAATEQQHD